MQTTVSVIIPSFNRQYTLAKAIDSVLAQEYTASEIILVDDGSDDNTAEWAKKAYPDLVIISQSNQGVSAARNTGIKHASGQWIALLDSDDAWYPKKLKQQLNILQQAPEIRLCHSNEHWIRNGRRVNQMNKHEKKGGWIFQHCLPLCAISPSASLIKKSVFNDLGGFDESLPACEDYDFWLRLCSREPVAYTDEALIQKYGGHEDQLSKQYWGMDRFRLTAIAKLLREHMTNAFLKPADQQAALATFRRKFSIYCKGAMKRNRAEHVAELTHQYADTLSQPTTNASPN